MNKIFTKSGVAFVMSIGLICILYLVMQLGFMQKIQDVVNDTFTYKLWYPHNSHNDDIVILKIDDVTLDTLGKSDLGVIAFDKGVYATVIEKIFTQYDAAVVGADIIFANPSVLGQADEQQLESTLRKYNDRVVIATRSDYNPHPLCLYSIAQHGVIDTIAQDVYREFQTALYPYDIASYCSQAEINEGNKNNISGFPREILDQYMQTVDPFTQQQIAENLSTFDDKEISYVDYYSNGQTHEGTFGFTSYSFVDVYNGLTQTSRGTPIDMEGKIVLIGEVGTLIHDSHFTPVLSNSKMPGVEINANMLTTLQTGRNIVTFPIIISLMLYIILFAFIIMSALYQKTVYAVCVMIIAMTVCVALGAIMFTSGYIFNIFLGLIGSAGALTLAYIYKFQVTDKAKRLLKKQFSSYVSPDIVHEISQNPDSVLVKGENRNMSIYFSDIVSFTTISENTKAEVVVEMLNEYFSEMTHIIYKNKGTLDKYIGDAVMCFFNAPLRQDNHSYYACLTALQQQKRLRELNLTWKQKNYPEINIRIGIHTGDAIHGNIGSSDTRVNYTVIGDSVNLASRIEGVGKEYGVSICVSLEVYELQKDAFHFRELDMIEVKGRKKPVRIFQLLGDKTYPLPVEVQKYMRTYGQALTAYRGEDYNLAAQLFGENTGDKTSRIMRERCKNIQEGKSSVNQGVFQMLTK